MDNVLMGCEVETYVELMKPQKLIDIGNEIWLEWHQRLQKLNQQAVVEATLLKDESVKEALVCQGKVGVLVHEAILVNIWKHKVLPPLLRLRPNPECTFIAYSVLYHEAIAVALLELVMYHENCCESLQDAAIDLLDYLCGTISQLLVAEEVVSENAKVEILRQRQDLNFEIGIRSLTIVRYLIDCVDRLPLCLTVQVFSTYDLPVLSAYVLLQKPWLRDGKQYKAGRWVEHDGESLIQCEAQVWLALCRLLLNQDCASHYTMTESRRSTLLKLQQLLTPTLLDQLSPLAGLQQCLCHLAVSERPTVSVPKAVLLETPPTIKQHISDEAGGKWKEIARSQLSRIFSNDKQALRKIAKDLSDAYNTDLLEQLEVKNKETAEANCVCAQCGRSAFQRCSRCKKQWYCSRSCQVTHWPQHKECCS